VTQISAIPFALFELNDRLHKEAAEKEGRMI
jgi:hypothetical protein